MRRFGVIASVMIGAVVVFTSCNEGQETQKIDLAVPVTVEEVKLSSIEAYLNSNGTARAVKSTSLETEIGGAYNLGVNPRTRRAWKLGDQIRKGEVLVSLKDDEYLNTVSIDTKKLNLEVEKLEHEKQNSLYKLGGVTLREVKSAEISYMDSQNSYEGAKIEIEKMDIKAPFTGTISALPIYTQDTEIASGTDVGTILDYSKLYLEVNIPEKYLSVVNVGLESYITSYTLPEDTIVGTISQLSPAIDEETRTFSGLLQIENDDKRLRPGMFVKADIITEAKEGVIVVKKELLLSRRGGKSLFIAKSGQAEEKRVKIGLENSDYAEIISGLSENDRLIISGYETLQNRSKVKIVK